MTPSVSELLQSLRERDIHLEAIDDRLRVNSPPGSLTQELKELLQLRKSELVAALRHDWSGDAHKVVASLPDQALRTILLDYFDEMVATIFQSKCCTRMDAEQEAFGWLLFEILRCGINVEVPT